MSSKVSTSDIRNVHIYNGATNPRELELCRTHRSELSDLVADKLDNLVATRLFQSQFKDFLPNPDSNEEVHVKIRINDREIIVQEIDQDGFGIGRSQKVDLDRIRDLDERDIDEAEDINQSLLRNANKIYRNHLNESYRRGRSVSPMRGRTSHESDRRAMRSLSPVSRRRVLERSRSPERRSDHHRSERERSSRSPARRRTDERRHERQHVRSASPTFTPRSRQMQRDAHTVETDVDLLHPTTSALKKESGTHPQIAEQLTQLEQQVRSLEQKLGDTSPLPIIPSNPEQRMQAISERLRAIESKIDNPRLTPTSAIFSEESTQLKARKKELEQKLQEISAENEILKARLPKTASSILPADFDKLIHLSQALASPELSGSTRFPSDLKEEFMKLPEVIRNAVYYQTYLLVDPLEALDPWPIGQRLFEGNTSSDSAMNLCRAHAIRHFLMHTLGSDFANIEGKKPPLELLRRFSQLPEEDKQAVYTQLEFIQPKGSDYQGPMHAFTGGDSLSVTNQERSIAINRVTLDRIAEYHRHHYREGIKVMEKIFQEAYENLRQESLLVIGRLRKQNEGLIEINKNLLIIEQQKNELSQLLEVKTLELATLQLQSEQISLQSGQTIKELEKQIEQKTQIIKQLEEELKKSKLSLDLLRLQAQLIVEENTNLKREKSSFLEEISQKAHTIQLLTQQKHEYEESYQRNLEDLRLQLEESEVLQLELEKRLREATVTK